MENMDTPPFSGMGLLTGKRMYEDGANVVLVDCDGAADPVIEPDDLRGNACRRSRSRARPSVFGQKNT